ncbi:MAG: lactate utilization protein [Betaproteobacteria bacterium]|jgi:L-lactate dehydrogenase complex protein LldG|nr:lactate utilization protein [Betaproteobacteria bacterium]
MSARDRILAKLNAAPVLPKAEPDVASWYETHRSQESAVDKASRFRSCIELAHAEVYSVTSASWLQKLWEVLSAKQIGKLLVAPGTPHGRQAIDELSPSGIECQGYDAPIEDWKEEMFHDIPASLTSARCAIAETGTLVLWPDADEPRLMSLVPPVHIVLLDASSIHNTFYEVMQREGWANGLPTNALLISGPSKTADIQVTLAYGAHGPKELVVLLIGDEA